MYESLFLDYNNDSKNVVLEYFDLLNKHILESTNMQLPYIQGDFPKKLCDFLADKELLFEERDPNEILIEMAKYFRGTTRWHHPFVMNNIKTPVNLPAAVVAFNAMLLDPNLAGDTNCGQIAFAELEVNKYMSQLVGWSSDESGGYFTFGGTSTIINAIKSGINKVKQDACSKGIYGDDIFIVSSEQGHSAHADACNWLGLGSENCVRIPVDKNYQMNIDEAEKIISERIEKGGKLAALIGCGGTTIQMLVDPIDKIYYLREKLVSRFNLNYMPHIHIDSVVGWVWLFFKGYNYDTNPLKLSSIALKKIQQMECLISKCEYADSIGVDFHKTGFCPYASSLFLTKNKKEIFKLNNKPEQDFTKLEYGEYSPSTYTLELSRSSIGPLTALTTLKLLGIQGFRRLLGNIVEGSEKLIEMLDSLDDFEVINKNSNGTCILFIIKPSELNLHYSEFSNIDIENIKKLALYNYNFYLFTLKNIHEKNIDFFIDYSSGYEKIKNGFHMGILKMQTFNPMLSIEKVSELTVKIYNLKKQYDQYKEKHFGVMEYKPKTPKLVYNGNKVKFSDERIK